MAQTPKIYGRDFPFFLFIVAWKLIGAQFPKPKRDDFYKAPRDITSFEIWQALKNFYEWFKKNSQEFPFSSPEIFSAPRELEIIEVARYLLEMVSLLEEGHLPSKLRKESSHYGACSFHMMIYTSTLNAFLNHLFRDEDFETRMQEIKNMIVPGRKRILNLFYVLSSGEIERFGKLYVNLAAATVFIEFFESLSVEDKLHFCQFILNRADVDYSRVIIEKTMQDLIDEFKILRTMSPGFFSLN
jgi:hypothetical protein